MRTIKLITEEDLSLFKEKVGYFLEGDKGLLKKHSLPEYSFYYKGNVGKLHKLTKTLESIDNSKELILFIEKEIIDKNKRIVDLNEEVSQLRKSIICLSDVLERINENKSLLDSFKKVINHNFSKHL